MTNHLIAYVILHYNSIEVTKQCVESIKEYKSHNSRIVIVDNCSPNNTGNELKHIYSNNSDITVLINKENAGFAKGNNIGYLYAKNNLKADIIVNSNNDVIFKQNDFEQYIIDTVDNDFSIGVVAPLIVNRNGVYQNPLRLKPYTNKMLFRHIFTYGLYYIGISTPFVWKKVYAFYYRNITLSKNANPDIITTLYNIVPHGSCVIFTPNYVEKSDYAFVPITFFYAEEDILFDYMQLLGLRTYFNPYIRVDHMEGISTSSISTDSRKRMKFIVKNKLLSTISEYKYRMKYKIRFETKR